MAVSQDGQFLAATDRLKLKLWYIARNQLIWTTSGHGGKHIAISPNNQFVGASGNEFTAQLWSASTGEHLCELKHTAYWEHDYHSVAFTPDSNYLITGDQGGYQAWDVSKGKKASWTSDILFPGGVYRIAISPNGHFISASGDIRLYEIPVRRPLREPIKTHSLVSSVAITSDGKKCAAGIVGNGITLREWETGQQLWHIDQQQFGFSNQNSLASSLSFSRDGKVLVSSSIYDKVVRFWDVATGALIQAKEDFSLPVKKVILCPNGETLVTCDKHQIKVWRLS